MDAPSNAAVTQTRALHDIGDALESIVIAADRLLRTGERSAEDIAALSRIISQVKTIGTRLRELRD